MDVISTCVDKLPCDDCDSSDSVQVYLNNDTVLGIEWFTSFCHGECWEIKGDPYKGKDAPKVVPRTKEDIEREIKEVSECPLFVPWASYRGIPGQYYKRWRCRTLYSEFDGKTPYAIAFPLTKQGKLTGWKCRPFNKKSFFSYGSASETDPFGFERATRFNRDTWWITEGEFDAIALDYCMSLITDKDGHPVISLTHGGGSMRKNLENISRRLDFLGVTTLNLVLDDDEVGILAEKTASMLWDKINIISKPPKCKDANEAVEKGLAIDMGKLSLYPLAKRKFRSKHE